MALPLPNKVSSLKAALSYSAIESIGSRVFDFATLWIVLNTLPTADLAQFGLATSALFFFNLIFITPETALLRYQKKWSLDGSLNIAITSYLLFSLIKISFHFILAASAYLIFGEAHWFFYAVVFSAITQQIQLAEIARIYMRMDLQQNRVAKFELTSKLTLCILCIALFKYSSLDLYFVIYLFWSLIIALCWLKQLADCINIRFAGTKASAKKLLDSILGFSFWSHISGVLTFYIYNSNILYLQLFSATENDIALYTAVSKVANLFFVIPMFFQSFVPVVLSNSSSDVEGKFKKLLLANCTLSVAQFIFFITLGWLVAPIFGVKEPQAAHDFYQLGIIINVGILFLNMTRPLSTYLLIKCSPKRIMAFVFIPSALLASGLYAAGSSKAGIYGCATGSALAYAFMATMLLMLYIKHRKILLIEPRDLND